MLVAETCKELVGPYGGRIDGLRLTRLWDVEDGRISVDALVGLVRRQEALTRLRVEDQSLLPFVSEALVAGAAQHLEKLRVEEDELERATALSLVRMLQANSLPALRNLVLWGSWRNARLDLERLIDLLAQGVSPRLEKLELALDAREEWHREQLAPIAAALKARQVLGCPGLAFFDLGYHFHWVLDGPLEARQALWAMLLPTIAMATPGESWRDNVVGG